MKTKLSPRKAIKEMCKACIYDPGAGGTWVAQTEACTSPDCPLYEHRPLTRETSIKIKEERIAAMSDIERLEYEDKCKQAAARLSLKDKIINLEAQERVRKLKIERGIIE